MNRIATFYDHMIDVARQKDITVVDAMKEAKRAGVDLLETSQMNILGREKEVESELAQTGLGISSVPAFFSFCQDTDVDRQADPVLNAAKALGAERILVIPGFYGENDGDEEKAACMRNAVECICRLAEKTDKMGLSLIMEPFDNALSPIKDVKGISQVISACGSMGVCFDTGNFRFAADDLMTAYETFEERIVHVHLKDRGFKPYCEEAGEKGAITALDGQRLYPVPVGEGDLDVKGVVTRLKNKGYGGIYSVEFYGAYDTLDYLKKSVNWLGKAK